MSAALNFLWFICNGIILGPIWYIVGACMAITIIGLPWARAAFVLGNFVLFPFGRDVISRKDLTLKNDIGTGGWGTVGNVIWFLVFGWGLALLHLIWGFFCAITIIGIPFAIQHLKLAGAALFPIGKTVEAKDIIALARQKNTAARLETIRN